MHEMKTTKPKNKYGMKTEEQVKFQSKAQAHKN